MLRLPPEAADADAAGRDVGDPGRASADAVAVAIGRIFEGEQLIVRNGLDEPGSEQRNRDPAREHRRLVGHDGLAAMSRDREQLEERLPRFVEGLELALGGPAGGTELENGAGAADRGDVVAHGAARAVERRAEALVGRLDLEEVVEAEPELRELRGRDAGERLPRLRHPRLRDHPRGRQPHPCEGESRSHSCSEPQG